MLTYEVLLNEQARQCSCMTSSNQHPSARCRRNGRIVINGRVHCLQHAGIATRMEIHNQQKEH
jgi:hypothetical protein